MGAAHSASYFQDLLRVELDLGKLPMLLADCTFPEMEMSHRRLAVENPSVLVSLLGGTSFHSFSLSDHMAYRVFLR